MSVTFISIIYKMPIYLLIVMLNKFKKNNKSNEQYDDWWPINPLWSMKKEKKVMISSFSHLLSFAFSIYQCEHVWLAKCDDDCSILKSFAPTKHECPVWSSFFIKTQVLENWSTKVFVSHLSYFGQICNKLEFHSCYEKFSNLYVN